MSPSPLNNQPEAFSPKWLLDKITSNENSIFIAATAYFYQRQRLFFILQALVAIFSVLTAAAWPIITQQREFALLSLNILRSNSAAVLILICISLFLAPLGFYWSDSRKNTLFLYTGLLGITLFGTSRLWGFQSNSLDIWPLIFLSIQFLFCLIPFLFFSKNRTQLLVFCILSWVNGFTFVYFLGKYFLAEESFVFFHLHRWMMVCALLLVEIWNRKLRYKINGLEFFSYYFSPIHLIAPIPILSSEFRIAQDQIRTRLTGLKDIALGLVILMGVSYYIKQTLQEARAEGISDLAYGWMNYIRYYFKSWSYMLLAIGILRWFGFNACDPYDAPLIAVNPVVRWRAWNVYYYQWFFVTIYLPLFRILKSQIIAIFAVFLVTYFVHEGFDFIRYIFSSLKYGYSNIGLQPLYFYIAHAFVLLLYFKTAKLWPSSDKLTGWVGVAVTHFLMALVHILG